MGFHMEGNLTYCSGRGEVNTGHRIMTGTQILDVALKGLKAIHPELSAPLILYEKTSRNTYLC